MSKYPNALAHLRIDMQHKTVQVLGLANQKEDTMAKKSRKSKKDNIPEDSNAQSAATQDAEQVNPNVTSIWKYLGIGKIDLTYACAGYTLSGRMVIDHSSLVDLLINYGFKINDILAFIDEFASYEHEDDSMPIVMMNANMSRIMEDIEPIEGK